ncbi:hypothetical protein G9H71_22485 [Motilibacter sp. E257]|uniref:Uncharacterized protein n=2 Tax=Motilibacter deserti TaxID=2714956 RepID=A0ABX0GZV7_9ACTN|nr:hypothetical protein [Motilibacter deserti]
MGWKRGPTLAARAAQARASVVPPSTPTVRPVHCWVSDPPGHPGTWPGLLIARQRGSAGDRWRGRVVYVVDAYEEPVLVEAWLDFGCLRPV